MKNFIIITCLSFLLISCKYRSFGYLVDCPTKTSIPISVIGVPIKRPHLDTVFVEPVYDFRGMEYHYSEDTTAYRVVLHY